MSKILDKFRLFKHQYENGKNFDNLFTQQPKQYIKNACVYLTQKAIKKQHGKEDKIKITNDIYRIVSADLESKTKMLKSYPVENPQNKLAYWAVVFDSLLDFVLSSLYQQHTLSFSNKSEEAKYKELVKEAKQLIPVLFREKPIEQDYDFNIGGMLIRECHDLKPADKSGFKHLLISDEEINAVKRLMEIFKKLPSHFNLQYKMLMPKENPLQSMSNNIRVNSVTINVYGN